MTILFDWVLGYSGTHVPGAQRQLLLFIVTEPGCHHTHDEFWIIKNYIVLAANLGHRCSISTYALLVSHEYVILRGIEGLNRITQRQKLRVAAWSTRKCNTHNYVWVRSALWVNRSIEMRQMKNSVSYHVCAKDINRKSHLLVDGWGGKLQRVNDDHLVIVIWHLFLYFPLYKWLLKAHKSWGVIIYCAMYNTGKYRLWRHRCWQWCHW